MRVLMAVSVHPMPSPKDLHVLDGSTLCAHLLLVVGIAALQGVGCTQKELERCAHCMSEVLLQMVPRLDEVRAAARGYPSAAQLAGMERPLVAAQAAHWGHALQHPCLCPALLSLNMCNAT